MSTPRHYTAFRIVLVLVVAATTVGVALAVADPPVWAAVLDFLGLG